MQAGRITFIRVVCRDVAGGAALGHVQRATGESGKQRSCRAHGRVASRAACGLLLAWPQPFEQVMLLPSAETLMEQHVTTLAALASSAAGRDVIGR